MKGAQDNMGDRKNQKTDDVNADSVLRSAKDTKKSAYEQKMAVFNKFNNEKRKRQKDVIIFIFRSD